MILGKRGEEMVEASIVLPLLILMIVSLISVLLHYYTVLESTADVHRRLENRILKGKGVFRIVKESSETDSRTKGLARVVFTDSYSEKGYVINMDKVIRLGRMLDEK